MYTTFHPIDYAIGSTGSLKINSLFAVSIIVFMATTRSLWLPCCQKATLCCFLATERCFLLCSFICTKSICQTENFLHTCQYLQSFSFSEFDSVYLVLNIDSIFCGFSYYCGSIDFKSPCHLTGGFIILIGFLQELPFCAFNRFTQGNHSSDENL